MPNIPINLFKLINLLTLINNTIRTSIINFNALTKDRLINNKIEIGNSDLEFIRIGESDLVSEFKLAPINPIENFTIISEVKYILVEVKKKAKKKKKDLIRQYKEEVNIQKGAQANLLAVYKVQKVKYIELIGKYKELIGVLKKKNIESKGNIEKETKK